MEDISLFKNLVNKLNDDFDELSNSLVVSYFNQNNCNTINELYKPQTEMIKLQFSHYITGDLFSFTKEDPAANGDFTYASNSNSFQAVKFYRFGRAILNFLESNFKEKDIKSIKSHILQNIETEMYKRTHIRINILSDIGENFIIDHGHNSEIDDFVKVGRNFHIMQDIKIKAINGHTKPPIIGKNVLVWSSSSINGEINVGDDVKIGTKCIIYDDLENKTQISLHTKDIIGKWKKNSKIRFHCFSKNNDDTWSMHGLGFKDLTACLVMQQVMNKTRKIDYKEVDNPSIEILSCSSKLMKFKIKYADDYDDDTNYFLKIIDKDDFYIFSNTIKKGNIK